MEIIYKPTYTKPQLDIFFNRKARFQTITKGRRFGFTHGAAKASIEYMLDGINGLWIDVVKSNIQRYHERYFKPELDQFPKELWKWNQVDKKLIMNDHYLDMRSSDNPEKVEGFGYGFVIINEAGIILKNPYIWKNAIRPMLLDDPKSFAIIAGVPKGKNLFYELSTSTNKNWAHSSYTSYDNPLLDADDIKELEEELSTSRDVVRQEIYGEFVDTCTNELIGYQQIVDAQLRQADEFGCAYWGLDVARYGDDSSVLCKRVGYKIVSLKVWNNVDTVELAQAILTEYNKETNKPIAIFVDVIGVGAGVYDVLYKMNIPVFQANVASTPTNKKFLNKRAECYWTLREKIHLLQLPMDNNLVDELQIEYFFTDTGKIQLESKREIKKRIGRSPDRADSISLTFFEDIPIKTISDDWSWRG
jgi:hypothetical protein